MLWIEDFYTPQKHFRSCTPQVLRSSSKTEISTVKSKDVNVIAKASTNKIQILEHIKIYLIELLHAAAWAISSYYFIACHLGMVIYEWCAILCAKWKTSGQQNTLPWEPPQDWLGTGDLGGHSFIKQIKDWKKKTDSSETSIPAQIKKIMMRIRFSVC